MDLEGLSSICAGLGLIVEDENGNRIGYRKSEFCLDNLNDLRRFLRRDDPQTRDVFKQVCKWNTVSKDLVPIIEQYQEDRNLVIAALKILVYVTMAIEAGSSDIPDQIDYLWELKEALSRSVTIAVIVSLLEGPLENLECGAFTEDDFKLVQLVLTLFKNILGIHDISMQQKASGSATKFLSLRDRFLELLFQENVADLILALTQYVGGSCGYLREDNLLLLEIYHYIFLGQEPELIAKASKNGSEVKKDVKASLNSLSSTMEEEKDKRRLSRIKNLDRHSQFRGSFTRLAMDGSKTLFKGNPGTASRDSLLKPRKVQRGPVKRIAWDNGRLSSSNETILKLLHDFMKQFISAGYNVLMQSIREDIEKEHDAFQNNDIVVFFQLSQFVTAFQHHTFLISKSKMGTDSSEAFVSNVADGTFFQGDLCGPIAATMNEAMFLLVISKWRYAFEGLKETNDYKFLSVAGSLMTNMIRMLDLVLKLLPEDSKEPQTARILLYKIFYDQTDQGMTQFLVNLLKAFDTHKQPKSDLADLIEMIHIVVRLMENLEARGTLRVSKKSRRGRKKKVPGDMKGTENGRLGEDQVNVNGDVGNSTCEPSVDLSMPLRELSENPSSDGKEQSVLAPKQVEEFEIPPLDNTVDESVQKNNKELSHDPDDIECGTGDSSEDDQLVATHEVDFKVSSLVSTFANNIIIQNLCWLLKFYKSNSASTNHYILTMLRRICDDLELSPMLYQLSLLTTFYSILAEQKSSPRKEYANIVSFLTNLVRKMLKKMKNQPLLFVETLFWKTRRECHYISSESLLNELGNLRKESRNWGNVSSGNEGEMGSSQGKGGIGRRSIADALGEDEIDLVVSHEPSYQKKPYAAKLQKVTRRDEDSFIEGNINMTSKSTSEMDGIENLESDDAHNEAHSFEHKTQKVSNRRKRLVFNPELETDIKDLYEKYKDERHCNRLIAEALDPSGGVSPAQVSTKLKQLGLKIPSKKRTLHVDGISSKVDGRIESEDQVIENDSIVHSLKELDESSLLKRSSHSRKRVRAFSKEQEVILKELYEQFKHHKKCSHMIAKALDADSTFTAAQVSRKIKQLGLIKEKTEAKKPLIDEDSDGLIADIEDESDKSDKETLLALKERRKNDKKNKIFREDVTATGFPKQKIERKSLEDDSDEEVLSSILGRARKKQPKERHGKLETSTVETIIVEAPRDQIVRDEHSPSNEPDLSHKGAEHDDLIQLDSDGEADQIGSINGLKQPDILMNDVNHVSPEVMLEELEDSGDDDVVPIASTNVVSRRKMKMVIDMDDDE